MTDAKILEDTIGVESYDGDEYRLVQLSAEYSVHSIEQVVARFRNGSAQSLVTLRSKGKPKRYEISEMEMDNLVKAWTQFKADLATLKAAKEAEKLRQFQETWAEITKLQESVPGLEITTMDSTWTNFDTMEDMPYTQVQLKAIGFHRINIRLPENILMHVKEAVSQYKDAVKEREIAESIEWYGWKPTAKENGVKFLQQHREWLAAKKQQSDSAKLQDFTNWLKSTNSIEPDYVG